MKWSTLCARESMLEYQLLPRLCDGSCAPYTFECPKYFRIHSAIISFRNIERCRCRINVPRKLEVHEHSWSWAPLFWPEATQHYCSIARYSYNELFPGSVSSQMYSSIIRFVVSRNWYVQCSRMQVVVLMLQRRRFAVRILQLSHLSIYAAYCNVIIMK